MTGSCRCDCTPLGRSGSCGWGMQKMNASPRLVLGVEPLSARSANAARSRNAPGSREKGAWPTTGAGCVGAVRQELTELSATSPVRKQLPPHAAGEPARQNCASQRFVTCVMLPAATCAEHRGSSTASARATITHRAIFAMRSRLPQCARVHSPGAQIFASLVGGATTNPRAWGLTGG